MDIFIVQSPLQVLSAFEARERFKSNPTLLVVDFKNANGAKNAKQIDQAIKITGWNKVLRFSQGQGRIKKHLSILGVLFYIRRIVSKFDVDRVFIGEYRAVWMHQIRAISRPRTTYLLDDGTAVIEVQNEYLSKGVFWPPEENYKTSVLIRFLYATIYRPFESQLIKDTPINLFTCFDIDRMNECSQQVNVQNSYHSLRSLNDEKERQPDTVFYFGQCLSEFKIVCLNYEISFIQSCLNYYRDLNLKFVYIPHRNDSQVKLEAIRNIDGVEVLDLDSPAELYFVLENNLPSHIGSAFSTVLQNLPKIVKFDSVKAFHIPPEKMGSERRERFQKTYDYYHSTDLHIIEFSL